MKGEAGNPEGGEARPRRTSASARRITSMEKTTVEAIQPKAKKQSVVSPDLSTEIVQMLEKLPGERVRCRRVSANTYRCNWLSPERESGEALRFIDTFRIRESKFLHVTKAEGKLVIEDWTQTAKNN